MLGEPRVPLLRPVDRGWSCVLHPKPSLEPAGWAAAWVLSAPVPSRSPILQCQVGGVGGEEPPWVAGGLPAAAPLGRPRGFPARGPPLVCGGLSQESRWAPPCGHCEMQKSLVVEKGETQGLVRPGTRHQEVTSDLPWNEPELWAPGAAEGTVPPRAGAGLSGQSMAQRVFPTAGQDQRPGGG